MNNNPDEQPTASPRTHPPRVPGGRWLLPCIAGALLLLLAASVPGYHLHIDEGWIGEQAYFLSRDGYVHSNLFEGFAANDIRIVVYHRLFVLLGSWAVTLFGWSIAALRVVPLLSGALLLGGIARHLHGRMGAPPATIAIALAIFLLMPLNFTYIKVYRPEMLVALCGFASYMLLRRYRDDGRWYWTAAAGIAATSAALAHPYGAIFPAAGMLALLGGRSWRGAALFALFAALPAIPYAIDILTHPDIFHAQIANPFVAEKTSFTILSPLLNLLEEHKRLFRKPETILPTVLFILALLAGPRPRDGERRFLRRYSLLLIVLLGALAQDKVTRYAISLLPFLTIEMALTVGEWMTSPERYGRWWRWGFGMGITLFAVFGLYSIARDLGGEREQVAKLNSSIASSIPPGTRVVGPVNFLFEEIERYPIIGLRYANLENANRLTMREAVEFADRHHAAAIVVNRYATLDEGIVDLDAATAGDPGGFRVAKRTSEYTLLRR